MLRGVSDVFDFLIEYDSVIGAEIILLLLLLFLFFKWKRDRHMKSENAQRNILVSSIHSSLFILSRGGVINFKLVNYLNPQNNKNTHVIYIYIYIFFFFCFCLYKIKFSPIQFYIIKKIFSFIKSYITILEVILIIINGC